MSIQSIINNYQQRYKQKGYTPSWLADLTRTPISRNISISDWNAAMDNIRKTASDSQAVNAFIHEFGKEFISYYERAIKSISYVSADPNDIVNPSGLSLIPDNLVLKSKTRFNEIMSNIGTYSDTMSALKAGDEDYVFYAVGDYYDEDVGFILDLNENEGIPISNILLYLQSVAEPVTVKIAVETANGWEDGVDSVILQPFTSSPPYQRLLYVNRTAKRIKIYQPKGTGYTNGRFAIRALDIIKANTTGYYEITDYTDSVFKLPMLNPLDFTNQMQEHVNNANSYANIAVAASVSAESSADTATGAVNSILDAEGKPFGFVRLDSNSLVPISAIPSIVVVNRQEYFAYEDTTEEDINAYLISQVREGYVQTNDYVDIVKEARIPSINNPNEFITKPIIQRSYVYLGSSITDRLTDSLILGGWKLIGTEYASYSAASDYANKAYTADRISGVLVRFGTEKEFENSDKQGVYFVSKYTAEELK